MKVDPLEAASCRVSYLRMRPPEGTKNDGRFRISEFSCYESKLATHMDTAAYLDKFEFVAGAVFGVMIRGLWSAQHIICRTVPFSGTAILLGAGWLTTKSKGKGATPLTGVILCPASKHSTRR